MSAASVAGIDQRGALACCGGQRFHRAVVGVTHHKAAHTHRFEILQRVARGFALAGG